MTGYVLFAHGSRIESANEAVRVVAEALADRSGAPAEAAFLELGQPDMAGAVESLVRRGVSRIVVVPYFLTLGLHMQRDLPRIVEQLRSIHRGVEFTVTEPLDGHPGLTDAVADRALDALKAESRGDESESQVD